MTRAEVVKLVALLAASWKQGELADERLAVYEADLIDLEAEVLAAAIARLRRTSKWLPTIAELRAAATDLTLGPTRTAEEAWEDVCKAIRRFGGYRLPVFDDPIVAECVEAMGWRSLCWEGSDVADRARFCAMYTAKQTRAREDHVAGAALPPARGYPRLQQPETSDGRSAVNVRALTAGIGKPNR